MKVQEKVLNISFFWKPKFGCIISTEIQVVGFVQDLFFDGVSHILRGVES